MPGQPSRGPGGCHSIWLPEDLTVWADETAVRLKCSRGELVIFALESMRDDLELLSVFGMTPERLVQAARFLGKLRGGIEAKRGADLFGGRSKA